MSHSVKYEFFMSQLKHFEVLKESDKTKICVVYHEGYKTSCILRICKNRDLSSVCSALRKIRNPNTVVVYDYVYEDGDTYILEENLSGNTVQELMENEGLLSEQETVKIIISVCKALEDLHKEHPPVVHNDINPSNIMIRDDGSVKLFDFDISRIYKKGCSQNTELLGTEEYASPEHFGYGQSEPRTDIYCLGVTMHKMLTGKRLTSEHRIAYNGRLKGIINKCLEFDPENRYTSVSALRHDLEKHLSSKRSLFKKLIVLLIVAIVIAGIVAFFGGSTQYNKGYFHIGNWIFTNKINEPVSDGELDLTMEISTGQDNSKEAVENNSRETAKSIEFGEQYSGLLDGVGSANYYKLKTNDNNAVYRCEVFIDRRTTYDNLNLALFDADGIKIEEDTIVNRIDDKGFYDFCLPADKACTLKVYIDSVNDTICDYRLIVTEKEYDAGIDKESATALSISKRHSLTIDSTIADWYSFIAPEKNDYIVTVHNIDVGDDIWFSKSKNGNPDYSFWVQNEDSETYVFSAEKGEMVYFTAKCEDMVANGTYIIIIEPNK